MSMIDKRVELVITETWVKRVKVMTPRTLKSDEAVKLWVSNYVDPRILDATSMVGVVDAGNDIDYSRKVEVKHGDKAEK